MTDSPDEIDPFANAWFLTGPTASGKSELGVVLAERAQAEIISLDSMALYRGMDIGTAKPSTAYQQRITHHLIDVVDPSEESSISRYLDMAKCAVETIQAKRKQPLFVGGTPLYLKALLRGLNEGPKPDPEYRKTLEADAEQYGNAAMHARLKMVDPLAASKIHENDRRRMVRALEVYHVTGKPMSHYQFEFDDARNPENCVSFWLSWPRETLHQRINQRVDWMFEAGLVEEVERIQQEYSPLGTTALQAVGYQEVLHFLDGRSTLDDAKERVKARTRQFAKRQCTWFRSLPECLEVPLTGDWEPEKEAELILQQIRNRT